MAKGIFIRSLFFCYGVATAQEAGRAVAEPEAVESVGNSADPVSDATLLGPPGNDTATAPAFQVFSKKKAVKYAYISTAAYCDSVIPDWDCGIACKAVPGVTDVRLVAEDSTDAHAYVAKVDGQCTVVFRGTDSAIGVLEDQKSSHLIELQGCTFGRDVCKVGGGFLEQYNSIAPKIKDNLISIGCNQQEPLAIAGHSLGAALTPLAILDLGRGGWKFADLYTFGQPRVADETFAAAVAHFLGPLTLFRVSRADDPFVQMPREGPFKHVGTEVFYQGSTEEGFRVCARNAEDPACSNSVPQKDVLLYMLRCATPAHCGHYLYMHTLKNGLMNPSSCNSAQPEVLLP